MEIDTIQCLPKKACTGCAACMNCCPVSCISMEPGAKGFLYPVIAEDRCVKCGKCKAVCPVLSSARQQKKDEEPACYAAWSNNAEIRFNSTSGGIFTHIAQAILEQEGYVVGARYRKDHLVEHAVISTLDELSSLRQSKYVQSEIGLVYRETQAHLKVGAPVLFAGTPCQCSGLRGFLGKEYENLFLCDFVCRGVNSPDVYLNYLRDLEKKYGAPVRQVWFKNKTFGWNNFATKISFQNGAEYLADRETDPYMLGYIKSRASMDMRPNCYECRFKGIKRSVDITLGDFWGIEKQFPELDTKNGISLLLVHTKNGNALLKSIIQNISLLSADLRLALLHNRCAVEAVKNNGQNKGKKYD